MPRPVDCPHCGEELDIPAELRAREVRCAACRNTFVPATAAAAGTPPRTIADPPRGRDTFDDAEPRPRRPKPRPGCSWAWVLLVGGLGCCGLSCGGLVLFGLYIVFPDFRPFDSQEGRFHADFPGAPTQVTDTDASGVTHRRTEFVRKFPPETYFVRYTDLPAAALKPGADAVLDAAADKVVRTVPGGRQANRSERKSVGGYPAVDVMVEYPSGERTVARVVLAGERLYVAGMTGGGLQWDSPHVQHFMDAFRITPAEPGDSPAGPGADGAAPPRKKRR